MSWEAIATIVVAIVTSAGFANWVKGKFESKDGTRENKLIDQLQEENTRLGARVERLEGNERILITYVYQLYAHIAEGKPPPPPAMPPLLRGESQ